MYVCIWSFISVCMYVYVYVCMCLAVRRARRQLPLGEAERVVRRALQVDAARQTGPLTLIHTYIHTYMNTIIHLIIILLVFIHTYVPAYINANIHTYSSGRAFPGPVWVGVSAAVRSSSLCPRDKQGQAEEERGRRILQPWSRSGTHITARHHGPYSYIHIRFSKHAHIHTCKLNEHIDT